MMASNGKIFGWTVAVITFFSIIVNGCEGIFLGIIYGTICGIFLVVCNEVYQKSKEPENQFPRINTNQRPGQTAPRIPSDQTVGPRIISITDRYGRQYQVPPHVPPNQPLIGGPGPSLQGIDYSQSECVVCLSPADFFCQNCGITLCRNDATRANYICPHCHVQLFPVRRFS